MLCQQRLVVEMDMCDNRGLYAEITVLSGVTGQVSELQSGCLYSIGTNRWASADLEFDGIAKLDGRTKMAMVRV